jgi:4-amino-4-deoxy-L-arabinose transferase-like glycosyltransferase
MEAERKHRPVEPKLWQRIVPPAGLLRAVLPLAILLLAFALRLYQLDQQSFAFDEGWTSYAIDYSWRGMWRVLAPDNHPPLYYLAVKALAEVAGYTDFPLRFFSVACSLVMVAALYALGQRLGGRWMAAAAALFAACTPSFVYYAQEARMYSLLMALGVLSSYGLLRLFERPRGWRWWALYVTATAGVIYTHYFGGLLIVGQNVLWALWVLWGVWVKGKRAWRERLLAWVLTQCAIGCLYLPWVPTLIQQARIGQGTWWRMPLPAKVIARDIWRFFVLGPRRPAGVPPFGLWLGPVALVGLVALFWGWRQRLWAWAYTMLGLIVPVATMVWIGSAWPIYTDRYTLVAAPGLALVVGLGVSACAEALCDRPAWVKVGQVSALALLLAVLLSPAPHLWALYHDPVYWREDFERAAEYVAQKAGAGDTVALVGCLQPVGHYYHGPAQVVSFPLHGDSVQDENEVVAVLSERVSPGSSVRLVLYSWETVDPQGLVEGALRAHCEFRGEHWQRETGLRPIRVMNFVDCDGAFAIEPRLSMDVVWGDQVALRGIRLVDLAPGGQAYVVLWWRTLRQPDQDYSAFVHLVDAQGAMIVQNDKLPLNAFYPMRAWPVGVDQRDAYPLKIPADAELEGASLAIGLYNAQDGLRLPVAAARGDAAAWAAGDYIRVPVAQLAEGD